MIANYCKCFRSQRCRSSLNDNNINKHLSHLVFSLFATSPDTLNRNASLTGFSLFLNLFCSSPSGQPYVASNVDLTGSTANLMAGGAKSTAA